MLSNAKASIIARLLALYCAHLLSRHVCCATNSFNCSQPPNFQNFDVNSCCRSPEIDLGVAPEKCDRYIKQLKLQTNIEFPYPSYMHICYPECIYHESGALINGVIQIDNVRTFLTKNIHRRDKDILPQILKSFDVCIKNIQMHIKQSGRPYAKLVDGCTPYASMIYGCVNAETFIHCPAKMWKNEHNCNLAKNFAEQCNPLPHVPLPDQVLRN